MDIFQKAKKAVVSVLGGVFPEDVKKNPNNFGLVEPEDVKKHPEQLGLISPDELEGNPGRFGLVTPLTVEVLAEQVGMTPSQMRKEAKVNSRDMRKQARDLTADAYGKLALAAGLNEDASDIEEALAQYNAATGKKS